MLRNIRIALIAGLLVFTAPSFALEIGAAGGDPTSTDTSPTSPGFSLLGTAWDPGANTARVLAGAAPGGATWSVMGAGLVDASGLDPAHSGATQDITALGVAGWAAADYYAMIDSALDVWAAVSGFTNLGQVADSGVNSGAPEPGGAMGDIRIAAWELVAPTVLAHAALPGNESILGPGGSIGGDMHFDVARTWVDNAADVAGNGEFDLFTVVLHELGHALGIGHSGVAGSVMEPFYGGARRTLHADDIAAIQAIYGPAPPARIPEPTTLWLLSLGLLGLGLSRRRS